MIGQRLLDSRHCFIHILQQKRVIVRLLGFRRQKSPGGCRRRYPSLSEQSRDERRNASRFGQLFFRLFIMLFDSPNFFHMHAPAFLYTKKESRTLSRILPLAKHGARRGSSFIFRCSFTPFSRLRFSRRDRTRFSAVSHQAQGHPERAGDKNRRVTAAQKTNQ